LFLFVVFGGMSLAKGLSIVMATRNESESISEIIRSLGAVLSKLPLRAELIIADYSEDDTLDVAMAAGERFSVKVVPLEIKRPGRGYAVRRGINITHFDLICLIDGDGNHDPRYIPKLLKAYRPNSIVSASRFPPLGWSEEHTFTHYLGNRIAVTVVNIIFGGNVTDITNGFYVFSKAVWNYLSPDSNQWSLDAQIICRALKRDVTIIEISYFEPKRQGGTASLKLATAFWRIGLRVFLEGITA
jgi:glycosyltransferase involved in cell wall biosynthesis